MSPSRSQLSISASVSSGFHWFLFREGVREVRGVAERSLNTPAAALPVNQVNWNVHRSGTAGVNISSSFSFHPSERVSLTPAGRLAGHMSAWSRRHTSPLCFFPPR